MSYNIFFIFGFGVFFTIYGVIAIIRKRTVFHLGRGKGSLPLLLSGTSAIIFGVSLLIGGLVMFFPIIRAYTLNRVAADDTMLNTIGVAGLIIVLIGLGFGTALQAAVNLGENIRRNRNKV